MCMFFSFFPVAGGGAQGLQLPPFLRRGLVGQAHAAAGKTRLAAGIAAGAQMHDPQNGVVAAEAAHEQERCV